MPVQFSNTGIGSIKFGTIEIGKAYYGSELVYVGRFEDKYTMLEGITSVRGAATIRVPFYMDHKYVTDIQFGPIEETSTTNRVLRPANANVTLGGQYWEADYAYGRAENKVVFALGGSIRMPWSAADAQKRNSVKWWIDTSNRRIYLNVNGSEIYRGTDTTITALEGDDVRGIIDNVDNYSGQQTIYRETEYSADESEILHDFIPVRRKSDGRLGFYDTVTKKFHCSANNTGLTAVELIMPEYSRLDYAQLNGDSWFNTGVQSSIYGYKFLIDATIVNTTVGSIGVNGSTPNWINITNGNIQSFSNTNLISVSPGDHVNYGLEFFENSDSKAFAMNLTQGSTRTITSTVKGTGGAYIHFLKMTNTATANAVIKVHDFRIWRQGVLVRDFIPVTRKFDNKVGFYDLVEGKFYVNQGANDFTAGPAMFKRVDYIEATGTQYIKTSYLPTTKSKIEFEFQTSKAVGDAWFNVFGAQDSNNSARHILYIGSANNITVTIPNPNNGTNYYLKSGGTLTTDQNNAILIDNNRAKYGIDLNTRTYSYKEYNCVSSSTYALATSSYPLFLFTRNDAGTANANRAKGKMYNFTAYDDGVLTLNLIPAIRTSDNKPGMYDSVSGTFLTNQGTGEFLYA